MINGRELPGEGKLAEMLKKIPGMTSISLNVNTQKTNVILGRETRTIWGRDTIKDALYLRNVSDFSRTGKKTVYQISPQSFYQVNPLQTEKLYSLVLDYAALTGKETVWDLYCGIGTISLFLAANARKVYGVEIVPKAVEHPDVIVVDPPRKGCDEKCLDTMLKMRPGRIVYVSCDSATLARDLRVLKGGGYEVRKVRGVDQFGETVHVETVCLLSKLHEAKHHVKVKLDMDEMDITSAESKATYEEIKKYVAEHNDGMKVSNLYIAQVKRKCGIELAENFNLPKSEDARQPRCPKEKEEAIVEALKAFQMI